MSRTKKVLDAEEIKSALDRIGDERGVRIIEEMQGYKCFYAFVVDRNYKRLSAYDIPDDNIHAILSVYARNEGEARKRMKERMKGRTDIPRRYGHELFSCDYDNYRFLFKFVDEDSAKRRRISSPRIWGRHIGLVDL